MRWGNPDRWVALFTIAITRKETALVPSWAQWEQLSTKGSYHSFEVETIC